MDEMDSWTERRQRPGRSAGKRCAPGSVSYRRLPLGFTGRIQRMCPRYAIHDISPLLHAGIPVWPGDPVFSLEKVCSMAAGAISDVSGLHMGLHTGAHVDAPAHYQDGGETVEKLDLSCFIGPARVVTVPGGTLAASYFEKAMQNWPERLLVRSADTNSASFPFFHVQAAELLGRKGLRLIGTCGASVDPPESKDLQAHKAFGRFGIPILEGLLLEAVPDGEYELIALPLRILGAEASPVRAVLRVLA
jgi:arylformamidase